MLECFDTNFLRTLHVECRQYMSCLPSIVPNDVGIADILADFGIEGFLDGVDVNNVVLPRAAGRPPFVLGFVLFSLTRCGSDLWYVELALLVVSAAVFRCVDSFSTTFLGFLLFRGGLCRASTDLLEVCVEDIGRRFPM
jgi:hypothetical protein